MSKLSNNWANSQRNSQAIRVAIILVILLFFALIFRENSISHSLLRTEQVSATIIDIKIVKRESHSRFSGPSKNTSYVVSLALANNKQLKFILLQTPPKVGTKVPVLADVYDDGKNYYHYSLIEWQLLK